MIINIISTNGSTSLGKNEIVNLTTEEGRAKARQILRELYLFCGRAGKKCYSASSYEEILKDDEEMVIKRADRCLRDKHYSIFDHAHITFEMRDIPKFLLMILNNEYLYSTSEQSARYTDFSKAGETKIERDLYTKWSEKIVNAIEEVYPGKFDEKSKLKLAQENARYMLSVFTQTSIIHTKSLRDLNNIVFYLKKFLSSEWENNNYLNKKFMHKLKPYVEEFIYLMEPLCIVGYAPKFEKSIAIFKEPISEKESLDADYRLNYPLSLAAYAQDHRHRSIKYSISFYPWCGFYTPPILKTTGLADEWERDIESVSDLFPQGMLVHVTESGNIEDFVAKCHERCCGRAQLEIQRTTNNCLEYLIKNGTAEVKAYLRLKTGNATSKCGYPRQKCTEGCAWGKNQKDRLI